MVMKDSKRSQAVGLRATANISRISAVACEFCFLYLERLANVSLIGGAICKTNAVQQNLASPPPVVEVELSQRSLHRRTNLSHFTKGCRERDASMSLPGFFWELMAPSEPQSDP